MNLQKRIKNIEEKVNQRLGQEVLVCFDRDGERVNKDGATFKIPARFDKEKDVVVNIDWDLRK